MSWAERVERSGELRDDRAERAFLGAMLVNPLLVERALTLVPEAMLQDRNRHVLRAVKRLHDAGSAVDSLTLRAELERAGALDAIGGESRLAELLDGVPRSANVEHYAGIIRSAALRRRLLGIGDAIASAACNGRTDADLARLIAGWRDELGAVHPGARVLPAADLGEILARPAPQTPWAVEELLAEGDVGLLSGPGGVGKSWLLAAWALALASGRDLFGRFRVTRPYHVALLDLETQRWEADQRLGRLAAGLGIGGADVGDRLKVVRQRIRLDDPEGFARLRASLEAWRTAFVFIDSWRRSHGGDDNRDAVTSRLFVECYDPLRLDLGCGALVVDHVRKRTGEAELDSADQALRGSTDKRNLVDMHAGVEERNGDLVFEPTKTRHHLKPEPIRLRLAGLEDEDAAGPVSVTFVGALDPASDRVQDALLALLEERPDETIPRGELIGRTRYSERAVGAGLRELIRRQVARKEQRGREVFYGLRGRP